MKPKVKQARVRKAETTLRLAKRYAENGGNFHTTEKWLERVEALLEQPQEFTSETTCYSEVQKVVHTLESLKLSQVMEIYE